MKAAIDNGNCVLYEFFVFKLLLLLLGSIECENIDVFCEKGIFECDQTERILDAGRAIGLELNFHAEELNYIGGAEVLVHCPMSNQLYPLHLVRGTAESESDESSGRNFRRRN